MAAGFSHGADTRLFSHPVGQRGVEYLYKHLTHIFFDPFVENSTQKLSPFFCRYGEWRKLSFVILLLCRGQFNDDLFFRSRSHMGVNWTYWHPISLKKR